MTAAPRTFLLSDYVFSQVLLKEWGVFPWPADHRVPENNNTRGVTKDKNDLTSILLGCWRQKWKLLDTVEKTGASLGGWIVPRVVGKWPELGTAICMGHGWEPVKKQNLRRGGGEIPQKWTFTHSCRVSGSHRFLLASEPVLLTTPDSGSEVPSRVWMHQINLKTRTEARS